MPYLSLHEYEGLLFSDPDALAQSLKLPNLAHRFHQVRNDFPTPEDIDDRPETAPSKRILATYSAYRKVIEGTLAARAVGIERMRQECEHFRNWLRTALRRCRRLLRQPAGVALKPVHCPGKHPRRPPSHPAHSANHAPSPSVPAAHCCVQPRSPVNTAPGPHRHGRRGKSSRAA